MPQPVIFRAATSRLNILPVQDNLRLDPFEVVVNGAPVRVVPEIELRTVPVDLPAEGPGISRITLAQRPFLVSLRAEVGPRQGTSSVHHMRLQEIEACASEALRRVLIHLRHVLIEPRLDVRLTTLEVVDWGMSGWGGNARLVPGPVRPELFEVLRPACPVTPQVWESVANRVAASKPPPLADEWLLEAGTFLHELNFRMAFVSAAITCEIAATKLVEKNMCVGGQMSSNQARDFAEEVSKRKMPLFLAYLGVLTLEQAAQLSQVFEQRNAILHGKRRRPIERAEAEQSVRLAQLLLGRLQEGTTSQDA